MKADSRGHCTPSHGACQHLQGPLSGSCRGGRYRRYRSPRQRCRVFFGGALPADVIPAGTTPSDGGALSELCTATTAKTRVLSKFIRELVQSGTCRHHDVLRGALQARVELATVAAPDKRSNDKASLAKVTITRILRRGILKPVPTRTIDDRRNL